jgi:hypothetical protein
MSVESSRSAGRRAASSVSPRRLDVDDLMEDALIVLVIVRAPSPSSSDLKSTHASKSAQRLDLETPLVQVRGLSTTETRSDGIFSIHRNADHAADLMNLVVVGDSCQ